MNITFRWYGRDNDTVTLDHIRQIPGTKGIVWALHQIACRRSLGKRRN